MIGAYGRASCNFYLLIKRTKLRNKLLCLTILNNIFWLPIYFAELPVKNNVKIRTVLKQTSHGTDFMWPASLALHCKNCYALTKTANCKTIFKNFRLAILRLGYRKRSYLEEYFQGYFDAEYRSLEDVA